MPPTSTWQRVVDAYRTLGFSLMAHPISLLRHQLPDGLVSSTDLEALPHGMPVHIPGLVTVRQRPETAKGITFMLLEDEVGLFNVIVYPDLYEKQRFEVRSVPFVVVEGRIQKDGANINIIATRLTGIEESYLGDNARVPWSAGDDLGGADADWRVITWDREAEAAREISRADLRAVRTRAHSYR